MDHHLGGQGIVIGGEGAAVIEGGVHPDAGAAGEVEKFHLAGAGPEIGRGVLGVDAALDGVAGEGHVLLSQVKGQTGGDAQLLTHQIHAGDHLRDAVLHLDPGIHLHEVEMLSVAVQQKFHSARALVVDGLRRFHGGPAHLLPQLRRQAPGGGLLNELLVPALDGAVPVSQVDDVALPVR